MKSLLMQEMLFLAIATGAIGTLLILQGIFYTATVFAAGMVPAVYFIREKTVN